MSLKQSDTAKGLYAIAQPCAANVLCTARFKMDLSTVGITTADKVELGILPMHCRVRGGRIIPEGLGATAIPMSIGIMSGDVGDDDDSRTIGIELANAENIAASTVDLHAVTAFTIEPTDADRSIGLVVGTNIAAGAGKSITLLLDYYL